METASSKEVMTKADLKDMATKADIAELKIEMAEQDARLVRHMYTAAGIIIAAVGVMITTAGLIVKVL